METKRMNELEIIIDSAGKILIEKAGDDKNIVLSSDRITLVPFKLLEFFLNNGAFIKPYNLGWRYPFQYSAIGIPELDKKEVDFAEIDSAFFNGWFQTENGILYPPIIAEHVHLDGHPYQPPKKIFVSSNRSFPPEPFFSEDQANWMVIEQRLQTISGWERNSLWNIIKFVERARIYTQDHEAFIKRFGKDFEGLKREFYDGTRYRFAARRYTTVFNDLLAYENPERHLSRGPELIDAYLDMLVILALSFKNKNLNENRGFNTFPSLYY